MTEQQPYEIVRTFDAFELRRYPAHLLAEVTIDASFEDAGNRAFRYLFRYISGDNRSSAAVSMTAPVVQAEAATAHGSNTTAKTAIAGATIAHTTISGAAIAMTAPVVQQAEGGSRYRVAFVLPASLTLETAPQPLSPEVTLRVVPESLTAALRFGGRWSQTSYQRHLGELTDAIADAGLTTIGTPRFARFDPPFKPWFLRRNEVVIDVEPGK